MNTLINAMRIAYRVALIAIAIITTIVAITLASTQAVYGVMIVTVFWLMFISFICTMFILSE